MRYKYSPKIISLFAFLFILIPEYPVCSAQSKPKSGTDISDMVLIYHGSTHRPDWNASELKPYIYKSDGEGFNWLFDGFLFLEIFDKNQKLEWDPGFGFKTAAKEDWEWLLERYFGKDKGPDALESVLDSLAKIGKKPLRPRRVVISIPDPVHGFTEWGEIGGKKLDFNNAEDQIAAACWFIDMVLKKWAEKGYRHLKLDGFYWVHEAAGKDFAIIPEIKKYLIPESMKLYWIPYWNAERSDKWKELGFDCAYQQPNYFFNKDLTSERLDDACNFGKQHGMGMELEFDNNVSKPEGRRKYYEYISSFTANGVWDKRQVAYYEGGGAWLKMSQSSDPEMKEMIEVLSSILIRRQEKADEQYEDNKITN